MIRHFLIVFALAATALLPPASGAGAQGALTPAERVAAYEIGTLAARSLSPAQRAAAIAGLERVLGKETVRNALRMFGASQQTFETESAASLLTQSRAFADRYPALGIGLPQQGTRLGLTPELQRLLEKPAQPFTFEGALAKPLPEANSVKLADILGNAAEEKARREQADAAREWLDRVEHTCHIAKSATGLAGELSILPRSMQEWSQWAHKKLELCPESDQEALLRMLETRLQALQPPISVPPAPGSIKAVLGEPSEPSEKLYAAGMDDMLSGNYKSAAAEFKAFIERYPNDSKASNAQVWLSYMSTHEPPLPPFKVN